MIRDGKLQIPVSLLGLPFVGLFRLGALALKTVRGLLTFAFLATGVGSLVALVSGGFGRKVKVLDYEQRYSNEASMQVGRVKLEERPGWARRFLGAKSRTTDYFAKSPESDRGALYFTADQKRLSESNVAKIQTALNAYKVMKHINEV